MHLPPRQLLSNYMFLTAYPLYVLAFKIVRFPSPAKGKMDFVLGRVYPKQLMYKKKMNIGNLNEYLFYDD